MRLIVDADPGIDDALALYYLRAQPDTEIVAIGTVHGNVPVELATANALRLAERLDIKAPVAMGAARPLAQPRLMVGVALGTALASAGTPETTRRRRTPAKARRNRSPAWPAVNPAG